MRLNETVAVVTPLSDGPARAVVHRTRGRRQGPITRLFSPSDLGEVLKPFVFLDLFQSPGGMGGAGFGLHPHSGIATLTLPLEGNGRYQDTTGTTGKTGLLLAGGIEWMRAGSGVWHDGGPIDDRPVRGYQLWIALPPAEENAPAESIYLSPEQVPSDGPARVLLGRHAAAQSPLPAPAPIDFLAVELQHGEHWRYTPPSGHTVAWVAVHDGRLEAGAPVEAGELAVFEASEQAIEFVARGKTAFVLGSAAKHPHDLVLGHYSVHTSAEALAAGEAGIARIGDRLRQEGRLGRGR